MAGWSLCKKRHSVLWPALASLPIALKASGSWWRIPILRQGPLCRQRWGQSALPIRFRNGSESRPIGFPNRSCHRTWRRPKALPEYCWFSRLVSGMASNQGPLVFPIALPTVLGDSLNIQVECAWGEKTQLLWFKSTSPFTCHWPIAVWGSMSRTNVFFTFDAFEVTCLRILKRGVL